MIGNNRVVEGFYSYIGPDGKIYTTHYTADGNGYRATGSHLPIQNPTEQPLPFISSTPLPFISSPPAQFVSSTQTPYIVPTSIPYRESYGPFSVRNSPTAFPIVSSSAPFASSISPLSVTKRPSFPIYIQRTAPFQGYAYNNPRRNTPYPVVSQQTPAPIFYQSSTEQPYVTAPSNINSIITTTLAPPLYANEFNAFSRTTSSPFAGEAPFQFREYIPPVPIVSSTPRSFNSSPQNPDTIFITPKPVYNQPQLPNSLSINQNLLPPYLSVGPLNNQIGPIPQNVAPLTVTNLNFRKKRNFDVPSK